MNVGSKERELHRLLEVLRIKAEIHVLVNLTFHSRVFVFYPLSIMVLPKVWDHISSLLTLDLGSEVTS